MARPRKVVGIRGANPVGVPVKDQAIIQELEGMLAEAKSGNIHGIVFGIVTAQRGIWIGNVGKADRHDMIAAAAMLANKVINA